MSEPGRTCDLLSKLAEIMNPNPHPIRRSIRGCADANDNINDKPNWKGSILYSLFLLVGENKTLDPKLSPDLPTICPDNSVDDIKKANDAANCAFAYVKTELEKKGVAIQFSLDFVYPDGDCIPLPAYFVLHHGESYGITADTISINVDYINWLDKQNV